MNNILDNLDGKNENEDFISNEKKRNKKDLIDDLVWDLVNDCYNNMDYIAQLLTETFNRRSKKEIINILYGE